MAILNKWPTYEDYLKSPEWQQKRSERLRIDNYKCQRCGRPMDCQVHHLTYDNVGNENVYTDLITLCKYCHAAIEKEKQEYRPNIMSGNIGWQEQYQIKWRRDRAEELKFCKAYKDRDISVGGDLNLLNNDTIRAEWDRWNYDHGNFDAAGVRVSFVNEYFRRIRIRVIASMEAKGATPSEIMARGISANMIRKYYGKPDVVEHHLSLLKYMED